MKFDLNETWPLAKQTLQRFPLAMIAALVVTAAAIGLEHSSGAAEDELRRCLLAGILGFFLFLALQLLSEWRALGRSAKLGLQGGGILLHALYFLFGTDPGGLQPMLLRFALLLAALLFSLPLIPLPGEQEPLHFWQQSLKLLLRGLYALLLATLLDAGLSAALASINYLFGAAIPSEFYLYLWIVLFCCLGPLVFLAGVPRRTSDCAALAEGPRWLDVLLRTAIIPLVLFYLTILYLYAAKILWALSWPKGGVAGYILGFCGVGIAAYLLITPRRGHSDYPLVRIFDRIFWPLLLPLALLLFLAVWRRVGEYGVTESRYLGIVLALWLAAMAVYFLLPTRRQLPVLFASLALLSLVVAVGPWSATNLSLHSQVRRLQRLLTENALLQGGKLVGNAKVPREVQVEISQLFQYLEKRQGLERVEAWFGKSLAGAEAQSLVEGMGLEFSLYAGGSDTSTNFIAEGSTAVAIGDFDYLLRLRGREGCGTPPARSVTAIAPEAGLSLVFDRNLARVELLRNDQLLAVADLTETIAALLKAHPNDSWNSNIAAELMTVEAQGAKGRLRIELQTLEVKRSQEGARIESVRADVWVGLK